MCIEATHLTIYVQINVSKPIHQQALRDTIVTLKCMQGRIHMPRLTCAMNVLEGKCTVLALYRHL